MKNRIDEYEVKLLNCIYDNDEYGCASIFSHNNTSLVELWGRNYKDKIKIETLMSMPFNPFGEEDYQSNFNFEATHEQIEKVIETLQKILKNRKIKE